MPNPPTDVKVEKVLSQPGAPWGGGEGKSKMRTYDEVLFADDGQTRKVYVPEDMELVDGETFKGWYNDNKGTWTIAHPNPPQNGTGGGTAASSGGGDYDRRPDHPVQMQRALWTASMAAAHVSIDQMFTLGITDLKKPTTKDEYMALLAGVTTATMATYPAAVLEQASKADTP